MEVVTESRLTVWSWWTPRRFPQQRLYRTVVVHLSWTGRGAAEKPAFENMEVEIWTELKK